MDLISASLAPIGKLQEGDPHECETIPDYSNVPRERLKCQILSLAEDYVTAQELGHWLPAKFDLLSFLAPIRVTDESVGEVLDRMSDEEVRRAAWSVERKRLLAELYCNCWYDSELAGIFHR